MEGNSRVLGPQRPPSLAEKRWPPGQWVSWGLREKRLGTLLLPPGSLLARSDVADSSLGGKPTETVRGLVEAWKHLRPRAYDVAVDNVAFEWPVCGLSSEGRL